MSISSGPDPEGKPSGKRARKGARTRSPADLDLSARGPTPTERLDTMTEDRIQELRGDKEHYRRRCEELQTELNQLRPENAHLQEVLRSITILNDTSTVLVVIGSVSLGVAAFLTEPIKQWLVGGGIAASGSGVFLYIVRYLHRRHRQIQ